jgi:hypothetical protein
MEDNDAGNTRDLAKALSANGYPEKVKEAIIEWYSRR